ncbi:SCO family protein [Aureibaculum luteum]|uniref:SCO family protein n=1 Tax=Aureibaculum luteum TaxID=1548456 RepID=UPI001E4CC99F|nr:SCO family protein [Aureibaculum luteum]
MIKSKFFIIIISFLLLSACHNKKEQATTLASYECPMHCEGDQTYEEPGSCPVCKMDLVLVTDDKPILETSNEISETSIFNLTSDWKTQNNKSIKLKELQGKTLVMVMIYTSCQAACPRLVADMRNIEKQIPVDRLDNIAFVFVSIDPETDTPQKLKAFAKENRMDDNSHIFLQGSLADVREFSNVLSVKYKQISPLDFSHSNIISVFDKNGELVKQQEGLGVDNKAIVSEIIQTSK